MIRMIKTWNIVHLWSRPDAVLLLFFFSSSLKNDPEAGCDDLLKRTRNIWYIPNDIDKPKIRKKAINIYCLVAWISLANSCCQCCHSSCYVDISTDNKKTQNNQSKRFLYLWKLIWRSKLCHYLSDSRKEPARLLQVERFLEIVMCLRFWFQAPIKSPYQNTHSVHTGNADHECFGTSRGRCKTYHIYSKQFFMVLSWMKYCPWNKKI